MIVEKTETWRKRFFLLLERPSEIRTQGKFITILIFTIIAINIASSILETVQSLYDSFGGIFQTIEIASIIFFTIEYILRVWVCVEDDKYSDPMKGRLRYMAEFLSIIDLLAFAPAYIPFLITVNLRFLRLLRFFRLFRLFKMGHYSDAFDLMVKIFEKKKEPLFITFIIGLIVLILSAVTMYLFENEAQPDKFPNAFTALYYSGITLASVGYGDIYPVTIIGKLIAAIMALLAVGLFVMPAGIIASAYYEELQIQRNPLIFCPECNQEFPKRQSFQLDSQDPQLFSKIKKELEKTLEEQEKREIKDTKFKQNAYNIQKKIFSILEQRNPKGVLPISISIFIIFLIVMNTLMILLETNLPLYQPYEQQWKAFEVFSVIIFTIEYVLRVWSCPAHINKKFQDPIKGRLRFMLTPMVIIDLLSFLPFYLPLIFPFDTKTFRVLRLIRILRILQIGHFTNTVDTIIYALKEKRRELLISLFIGFVILVFSSTLIYYAEENAPPDKFSDIPSAMWWSVVTLTTVGYGDIYPVTTLGRFIAVATAFIGVGLISLPTGIVGSGLMEAINYEKIGLICPICFYSFKTHQKLNIDNGKKESNQKRDGDQKPNS